MDPELYAEAQRLLNQARMISEVSAAQAAESSPKRNRRRPPQGRSNPPAGTLTSTLAQFGRRINAAIAAGSDSELAAANRWCAGELKDLQHSASQGEETPAQFRYRILTYEGVPAPAVARKELTSVTTVRKFRDEDGRDMRYGRKLPNLEGPSQ